MDNNRRNSDMNDDFYDIPANNAPSAKRYRVFNPPVERDRRTSKSDYITVIVQIFCVGICAILVAVICLMVGAQPLTESVFSRLLNVTVIGEWNRQYINLAFALLVTNVIICVVSFILSLTRQRRKTDKINIFLPSAFLLNAVGIVMIRIMF